MRAVSVQGPALLQNRLEHAGQKKRLVKIAVFQMKQQIRVVLPVGGQSLFKNQTNDVPGLRGIGKTRRRFFGIRQFRFQPFANAVRRPRGTQIVGGAVQFAAEIRIRFSAGKIQISQNRQGIRGQSFGSF